MITLAVHKLDILKLIYNAVLAINSNSLLATGAKIFIFWSLCLDPNFYYCTVHACIPWQVSTMTKFLNSVICLLTIITVM